jgi:hypothetical protein
MAYMHKKTLLPVEGEFSFYFVDVRWAGGLIKTAAG